MKKLLFVALLAACGGGGSSGVDGNKKLVSLSTSEQTELCQYFFDTYPKRTIMCSSTDTRTIGASAVADCVSGLQTSTTSHPNCAATVGQGEDCINAEFSLTDAQVCAATSIPAACAPLETADCGGA